MLRPWLKLFLPLALAIGALYAVYAVQQQTRADDLRGQRERTTLKLATERFSQQLGSTAYDLRVIARAPTIQAFINGRSPEMRAYSEAILVAFAAEKWEYRQLRLLSGQGMELIRVDRTSEGPRISPRAQLQDKSHRDYFQRAMQLRPEMLSVSRFDLNMERGVIERPIQPTLRLSMQVQSRDGTPYVLVANLRGPVLLKGLRDVLASSEGEAWLLDQDGYWLIHGDPGMEWGAQLAPENRVQEREPGLAALLGSPTGTAVLDRHPYYFQRIRPMDALADAGVVDRSPEFDLVIRFPAQPAWLLAHASQLPYLLAAWILAGLACALVVRSRQREEASEARREALVRANAAETETRAWIRDQLYQLSLRLSAASSHREMASDVLRLMAPLLGVVAAAIYGVRAGESRALASYGAPEPRASRDFAAGEGLVGEVARNGTARRMTPPPGGYLDLQAGLGSVPCADLRVVPLEIHGRVVGVLELAFSARLEEREEDYLRQALPLVALHLEGFERVNQRAA